MVVTFSLERKSNQKVQGQPDRSAVCPARATELCNDLQDLVHGSFYEEKLSKSYEPNN